MPILLNFTFFAQVINFFITYWFCNRFFFKPVLKIIIIKRQQKKFIEEECSETKLKLLELEEHKKNVLHEFQLRTFEKQKLLPEKLIVNLDEQEENPIQYQNEELLAKVKTLIKSKVLHDC